MKDEVRKLTREYVSALQLYLRGGGEATLLRAYELGREALGLHLGVLEMAALHQEALVSALLQMLAAEESQEAARKAAEFFVEAMAPFEMSRRGIEEANALLHELNSELQGRIRTTEERLEETKRMEQLKNEFISIVSHELRTPLTSISASLGLIRAGVGGEASQKVQTLVDVALRNTERLVRLVNDMLDVQRIESNALAFDLRPFLVQPLLAQAIEVNQAYAAGFGVDLSLVQIPGDARILVDLDRFMQVMANLLSNAVKFSPRGETVSVGAVLRGDLVRVTVSDRGPGIPKEFRSRIFQKFAQADSPLARGRGCGLGLSITKSIVERLQGRIAYANRADGGTTFFFELPLWNEDAAARAAAGAGS
jgi:signal transduction histidine kinase